MTWGYAIWYVNTQPPIRLCTITRKYELFELLFPVVARLAKSCKAMRSIILNPIIGAVGHEFTPLFNGTNNYECPNEQKF